MTDKRCVNYQDGFCLKGLDGTKCELEGCVAHIAMTDKQIIKRRLEQEMGEITYGVGEPIDVYEFCEKMISFIDALPPEEEPKLSNVEQNGKNRKEEPVSIDFEQELYNYFGQVKDFTLGMRIAKRFYDMGKNSQEPVSEELEEEVCRYINDNDIQKLDNILIKEGIVYVGVNNIKDIARHFANWQRKQIIDKACEWLDGAIPDYIELKRANVDTFIDIDNKKFVEDFCKAMED